jgi:hypothetical protein
MIGEEQGETTQRPHGLSPKAGGTAEAKGRREGLVETASGGLDRGGAGSTAEARGSGTDSSTEPGSEQHAGGPRDADIRPSEKRFGSEGDE